MHSKTRSKGMIDTLHKTGLCVTYDRVLLMSSDLVNAAITHFESIGAVCPQSLKMGIFTTSAVDNIDHDPTSTSSQNSFRVTGISLFQHPDANHEGNEQTRSPLDKSNRPNTKLPTDYSVVPTIIGMKYPPIPAISELKKPDSAMDIEAETHWWQHVYDVIRAKTMNQI